MSYNNNTKVTLLIIEGSFLNLVKKTTISLNNIYDLY